MNNPNGNNIMGIEQNTFCMLLHLSQLLGLVVPALGLVVPIVLWALNKEKHPIVDQHGKIIFNWLLSCLIYTLASIVLTYIIGIGIITILVVVVAAVAFPIMGGLKANDGIVWKYELFNYPVSIQFLK